MLEKFTNILVDRNLLRPRASFIVAVSGGIDSVVLCELCNRAGLQFSLAHCNFGLRGAESVRDENFVKELAKKYAVRVEIKQFETAQFASDLKFSIQEAARNLRYEWFQELLQKEPDAVVLLAHHANDNIETLLLNFLRGTGLEGLTGIKAYAPGGRIFRPLLDFTRIDIAHFATVNHLEWVEDSSNESSKYTRNFLRNELIPFIKQKFPQVENNLLNSMERFRQINEFYQLSIQHARRSVCEYHNNEVRIPVKKLRQLYTTSLIYEIFKEYGFGEKQIGEIQKLLVSASGKFIENEKFQVIRHRNWLLITPKITDSITFAIDEGISAINFENRRLQLNIVEKVNCGIQKSELIAQLDAKEIVFPLVLRKWKQGDYFYPLGMRKKKKIARFFIDQKLSKHQKERTWVIESNNRIAWVVGMRIDDRFKITSGTKQVLELSLSSP